MAKYKKSTIIKEGQELPKQDKSRHYVDKKEMYDALVERRKKVLEAEKNGKPKPEITNFLAQCLMQIAENLSYKHYFRGYKFRDEMVGDAVLNCCKYIDSFDPDKSENPFAYFTQACYFAFISRIEREKKQTYIKFKQTNEQIALGELADTGNTDSTIGEHILDNIDTTQDYMDEYVDKFEEKNNLGVYKKPKKKKGKKKEGLDNYTE